MDQETRISKVIDLLVLTKTLTLETDDPTIEDLTVGKTIALLLDSLCARNARELLRNIDPIIELMKFENGLPGVPNKFLYDS